MNKHALTIAFVGDVNPGSIDVSRTDLSSFPQWPAIRDAIGSHELLVGNLDRCLLDERDSQAVRIGDNHLPHRAVGYSGAQALHQFRGHASLIADRTQHRRAWWQRCRAEAIERLLGVYYMFGRSDLRGVGRTCRQALTSSGHRRWIRGLMLMGHL